MTFRERIIATFKRQKTDRVLWQPRIEHWYNVNRVRGNIPEKYSNKTVLDIYDDLNASPRYYYGTSTDISEPETFLKITYKNGADIRQIPEKDCVRLFYKSPKGQLTGKKAFGEWGCSWHFSEFPIKKISDFEILEYILQNTVTEFNYNFYQEAEKQLGDRGICQFYFDRSPLQNLFLMYMGIENTIYANFDQPQRIKEFLKIAGDAQDQLFEVLGKCPVSVLNFGENIDGQFDSPQLFNEYLVPYYQKRLSQLHKAGKFCHIHMDGALKPLLPYINDAGFDAIEAATPLPQGDVTIEQIKDAMGDTILMDGIPAILFLPDCPDEELKKFTRKVIDLFSPNLILGISDEISPVGDIEKVRLVSKLVNSF
jgi:hypothetical protein